MKKIIIASPHQNAGKTSLIVGLAKALNQKVGYLKPLGDRLLYQKKRQWDYDSATMTNLVGIQENPEDITIGFEHSKLRFMYDEKEIRNKLSQTLAAIDNRDIVFIESGKNLSCGMSVHLDPVSLASFTTGKLIVVISGTDDEIYDDVCFLKKYLENTNVDFGGVIINKIRDKKEFEHVHLGNIKEIGLKILGVMPYAPELTHRHVAYLADKMFAKVIAGEENLTRLVKTVVVGAMSANSVISLPIFRAEDKLVITSGDRSDMIVAALETNSAAIILTNNILPPANIISKATELGIPLLLVRYDTFEAAKQVDDLEPLLTKDDAPKAELLGKLATEHINIEAILG
ncbi:MAG: DRTGG domain-containing protein [Pseudomonadota bacterium]